MNLPEIEAEAWEILRKAPEEPKSAFRYLTLCSVDASHAPQARVVVLRKVDTPVRSLEFHTDTRSRKWQEFAENPAASVVEYCPDLRLQLRLSGTVILFAETSSRAEKAWDALPPGTKETYQGGPPGDYLSAPPRQSSPTGNLEQNQDGRRRFGVIVFTARSLDWCQLDREGNKRALFAYTEDGKLCSSQFVHP